MTTTTTTTTESTIDTVAELQHELSLINMEDKLSLKLLAEKINEIVAHLQSSTTTATRDRGPKSEKDMSEDDARRIQLGDLKDVSHKDAALQLGLSYGQIYSARKGFTFKNVYKEVRDAAKAI